MLFFKSTSFLFFGRILDARGGAIDWTRLFASRLLRLLPLYLVAMLGLFLLVAHQSGAALRVPAGQLTTQTLAWLGFTFAGAPDINGVPATFTLIAGVTWSLPYECCFYLMLPWLAQVVGLRVPAGVLLVVALVMLGIALLWLPRLPPMMAFAGGLLAAVAARRPRFRRFASRVAAGPLVLICLLATGGLYPSAFAPGALLGYVVAFCLMAAGNDVFGVLRTPACRILGEAAYSIYLLHGLLLCSLFALAFDRTEAATWSAERHWYSVAALAPCLTLIALTAYRLIERPAMEHVEPLTAWAKSAWLTVRRTLVASTGRE